MNSTDNMRLNFPEKHSITPVYSVVEMTTTAGLRYNEILEKELKATVTKKRIAMMSAKS
jgi:hypothetical protein